jgi:peptidyl-prolyl cis-trans isomerase C
VAFAPVRVEHASFARVNGIALHAQDDRPDDDALRQRAYGELLRQEAIRQGLLGKSDIATDDGIQSEAAVAAIELLLERNLQLPQPDEIACHRYYEAQRSRFQTGERVHARHILFAVTPGVDVVQLRKRAESALLDARCRDDAAPEKFADLAVRLSNCPSGANGGDLGWLSAADCAPEFARELFGHVEVGVLPRLVHSRFGLHVVEVIERNPGVMQDYESVRGAVALALHQHTYITALRQFLQLLASEADVEGIVLETADTPLVQ